MKALAIFLLTFAACRAQSARSEVEAVLQRMEHAEQTGDFNTWQGLWTPAKAAELEGLRRYAQARPEVRYRALTTYVQGDRAVLLVEGTSQFVTVTLAKESGQWKIQDEVWRDTAPAPTTVYALAPPALGAFARAGSPWDKAAPGMVRAVFDDVYLYVRIEADSDLPAPGATIVTPPGGWPNLRIAVSGAGDFVLYDTVNVGDQATFDKQGKANSHRAFAAYMIRLERNGREVLSSTAGLEPSPLLTVAGRDYDIRLPLVAMGLRDPRPPRITVNGVAARRFP
jgi:hypothetical protein